MHTSFIYDTRHERKTPKQQQVEHYQHLIKTSDIVNCHQPGCYVSTRKNFAHIGSFAQDSVPVYLQLFG